MDFEHSATTTRLFAGAMGDVEVEVTACRCRTEETTVSVDCKVIVQGLAPSAELRKAHRALPYQSWPQEVNACPARGSEGDFRDVWLLCAPCRVCCHIGGLGERKSAHVTPL